MERNGWGNNGWEPEQDAMLLLEVYCVKINNGNSFVGLCCTVSTLVCHFVAEFEFALSDRQFLDCSCPKQF